LTVKKPNNISLYVNGGLVNSSGGTFVNDPSSSPLVVGDGFVGVLDELAFSKTALDSSVILSDYSKGLGGNDYCSASGKDSSGTETEFIIEGCYSPLLEKPVPLNTCSSSGKYICVNTSIGVYKLIDTTKINDSCKAQNPSAYPEVSLRTDCCPSGMKCSKEGNDDKYICRQRTEVCSDYDNKGDCQANNCFWVVDGDDEFCVENPRDYSCSVYYNETLCKADEWNLGQEGVGTDVCGTYVKDNDLDIGYRILQGSCRCEWDSVKCVLAWDTSPDIYGSGDRNNFTCQKFYNTSACIDGKQTVNWTEKISNGDGIFKTITTWSQATAGSEAQKILNLTGCKPGETIRSCGDSIVKLPFFSLFSLIAAGVLIGLFYWATRSK